MAVWSHVTSIAGLPNSNTSHCDRQTLWDRQTSRRHPDRSMQRHIVTGRPVIYTLHYASKPATESQRLNKQHSSGAAQQLEPSIQNLLMQPETLSVEQQRRRSCAARWEHHVTMGPHFAFSHWVTLTLCVIVVLGGLHSLADLHANDVNFGLAVLQHLQSRLEHLLILREGETIKGKWPERREEVMVGPSLACFMQSGPTLAWKQELERVRAEWKRPQGRGSGGGKSDLWPQICIVSKTLRQHIGSLWTRCKDKHRQDECTRRSCAGGVTST